MIGIFLIFFSNWSMANVSDRKLEMLIGARSTNEMQLALSDSSALQSLKADCSQHIELKRIPEPCFRAATLELRRKLISEAQFESRSRWLNGFCRRVARESHDLIRLQQTGELSGSCRKSVQSRIEDLTYQLGEVRELDRFLK